MNTLAGKKKGVIDESRAHRTNTTKKETADLPYSGRSCEDGQT